MRNSARIGRRIGRVVGDNNDSDVAARRQPCVSEREKPDIRPACLADCAIHFEWRIYTRRPVLGVIRPSIRSPVATLVVPSPILCPPIVVAGSRQPHYFGTAPSFRPIRSNNGGHQERDPKKKNGGIIRAIGAVLVMHAGHDQFVIDLQLSMIDHPISRSVA